MKLIVRLYLSLCIFALMGLYSYFIMLPYTACFSGDGNPSALGLTFGYDTETALHFLSSRDAAQIQCYTVFLQVWDCLFPFVYTALFLLWFRYFFSAKIFLLLPILMIAADLGENFTELALIHRYDAGGEIAPDLVQWGSLLTFAKWSLAALNVAFFLGGALHKWQAQRKK